MTDLEKSISLKAKFDARIQSMMYVPTTYYNDDDLKKSIPLRTKYIIEGAQLIYEYLTQDLPKETITTK